MTVVPNCVFLSHGTIPCSDLQHTIKFLTKLFGFEHVQTSDNSASFRMGGNFCFSAIENYDEPQDLNADKVNHHFGIDMANEEDIQKAYDILSQPEILKEYKIQKITAPAHGHGTYFIYVVDQDSVYWELLVNPPEGYMYRFLDKDTNTDNRKWKNQENMRMEKQKKWKDELPTSQGDD
jgi:catechol 2,3-dioxygenase-like lactoylglutathione lyase family enzyme